MKKYPAAVLFDLDGTLVDTAPDMVAALCRLCIENGLPETDYAAARPHVSNGSLALVKLAFGDDLEQTNLARLRQRFLELYAENVCVHSHLFAGMPEVLEYLSANRVSWGIVTNKPGALTAPLVKALTLSTRASCVISGDTLAKSKPDPLPLLHASELMNIHPGRAVYIGDSIRDIQAGNAAGMQTVSANYGYIVPGDDPSLWQADDSIDNPLSLIDWLEHRDRTYAP